MTDSRGTFGIPGPANLTGEQAEQLAHFVSLVSHQGAGLGLTGFPTDQVATEVARSVALRSVVGRPQGLVDVGSGAGFPGVPLAIVLGSAVLVEPRRWAAAFLEMVAREVGIHLDVVNITAQEAARSSLRESAEVVVARALAPAPVATELCAPLCRPGGRVILTARRDGSELPSPGLLNELGLEAANVVTVSEGLEFQQQVLIMDKFGSTSPKYPRNSAKPTGRRASGE